VRALILRNPMPYSDVVRTVTAPLARWAVEAPDRVWLAEREGEGWRTITFADAKTKIEALAGGLCGLGLGADRPLLILARNGDRPRADRLRRHEPGRADRAGLAAVRPEAGAELTRLATRSSG
jgi:feruloyl-CoA synthase